jgi:Zn-dependent metalloprotease
VVVRCTWDRRIGWECHLVAVWAVLVNVADGDVRQNMHVTWYAKSWGHGEVLTGSWAMMDCSWGGERMPASRRYSSSVRMVLRERLTWAASGILD